MTLRSGELERAVAAVLRSEGYRVELAKPVIVWRGPRLPCRRCGNRHPTCNSKPRSVSHDLFGCVDVFAKRTTAPPYWVVARCGPGSKMAQKRRDLLAEGWPPGTALWAVAPDRRVGGELLTVWRLIVGQDDEWERATVIPPRRER